MNWPRINLYWKIKRVHPVIDIHFIFARFSQNIVGLFSYKKFQRSAHWLTLEAVDFRTIFQQPRWLYHYLNGYGHFKWNPTCCSVNSLVKTVWEIDKLKFPSRWLPSSNCNVNLFNATVIFHRSSRRKRLENRRGIFCNFHPAIFF